MKSENHALQNAKGWASTISAFVAALNAKESEYPQKVDGEEYEDSTAIHERILELPLSVQVRSDWTEPGEAMEAGEFEVLLTTGGLALRIIGELDQYKAPVSARLEYQDWGTPWTEYRDKSEDFEMTLLGFCQQFYYGE